jgi:hypothetical protein
MTILKQLNQNSSQFDQFELRINLIEYCSLFRRPIAMAILGAIVGSGSRGVNRNGEDALGLAASRAATVKLNKTEHF